ncbi:PCC domain-containing protein [Streptomyces sp. NPDC001389]|uniref:PCC domain-containing protein n=1 Tax=Streptomyces sp. NPDC001389 TaxID=3364569 RepID=UPI0036B1E809
MFVAEVKDAEIIEEVTRQAAEAGITDAAVVTVIGAVDSFTVSTMPADDPSADIVTDYKLPGEITGAVGELRDGKVHLHLTLAVEGDRAVAGHLHKAQVGAWFARVYLLPA